MNRLRAGLLALVGVELAMLVALQFGGRTSAVIPSPETGGQGPQSLDAVALTAFPDRIADAAGVLGGFHNTIEWQIQGWRDDLGIEVHVVTLRSKAARIEALADRIFQERRIGDGAPSGGLLLLLNPMRGQARIEVSYSLEHVFPDLIAGRLARDQLAPFAAYRVAGMAMMDTLGFLKDYAYLQAVRGAFALPAEYRERSGFVEKARFLSGGGGARATLEAALQEDRDFKAPVPAARRDRYAPSTDPMESVESLLRAMREQVGDPTLDLYTPGTRCMLEAYPYAPFEQLERLERAGASKPLRVTARGDHAVADSDRPVHGFVPILLERRDGRWRVDLVETWKNLFFDAKGDYFQKNSNHPYAFALDRLGAGANYRVAPWLLGSGDLEATRRAFANRSRALDEFLLAELLFRNCFLPIDAFAHYERAIALAPHNLLFNETLGWRAAYLGFADLAVNAFAELGPSGLLLLAYVQRDAGDVDAAIESVRKALDRDPLWIEGHELLSALLEKQGDRGAAQDAQRRAAAIRSDPAGVALALTFDPPTPTLHAGASTKVGDTAVYDHSFFAATLTNPSSREVEIASVTLTSDGTSGRSQLGDIKDHWQYPAGSHRLGAGESVRFEKTWGFTEKTDHQQLRYAFDVCWKTDGERRCRDYWIDLFPPFDVVGIADPSSLSAAPAAVVRGQAPGIAPDLVARLELLAMLRDRRFRELTQRVEAAQAAFEADPEREEQVAQMWDTFATSDPSLGPLLEAWAAAVDSYAPRVALGVHHRRRGWAESGARSHHFEQARKNLHRALELHPRLAVAFEYLLNVEKWGPATPASARLVEQAARVCPSCVRPPFEYLIGLSPNWGGSHVEMGRFVTGLAPRIEKFPRLAVLRGAVAADLGDGARSRREYEKALRFYDEALRHGEYWYYRRYRGQALIGLGRHDEAHADFDFWLAHGTRTAEALLWKAHALGHLRRFAEAGETIDLARRLEPTDAEILKLANYYGTGR